MVAVEKTIHFHFDLHVHSALYSECAESLDPFKLEEYAKSAGIDGILLTEHDALWSRNQLEELQHHIPSVVFYNGVEVTARNGIHLVILGISEMGPLYKGIYCNDAISYAHDQGGIVILAHPFRNGLPQLRVIERVDAIEIGSTSLTALESELSQNLARSVGKPMLACSDAHALQRIGWAYTSFLRAPENERDLCQMIKSGQGKPILPNPFFR